MDTEHWIVLIPIFLILFFIGLTVSWLYGWIDTETYAASLQALADGLNAAQ